MSTPLILCLAFAALILIVSLLVWLVPRKGATSAPLIANGIPPEYAFVKAWDEIKFVGRAIAAKETAIQAGVKSWQHDGLNIGPAPVPTSPATTPAP